MSDFLSNFDKNKYSKTLSEKNKQKETTSNTEQITAHSKEEMEKADNSPSRFDEDFTWQAEEEKEQPKESSPLLFPLSESKADSSSEKEENEPEKMDENLGSRLEREEETEIDPTYKKRKKQKIIIGSVIGVIACVGLFFLYYSLTHVTVPNFKDQPLSDARTWATENKVDLEIKQEYSLKYETNQVMKQSITAGKKVKKKGTLTVTASKGPDPDERLPLPDFSQKTEASAKEWASEQKAENLSVIAEYSDTVEKGKYIRQEISDKEITPETYRRKDKAIVYYSKGKEVFTKDISVPDFVKKAKTEVESWAQKNEIQMTYKEEDSDTVEAGMILSQSIAKDQKIAKRDSMEVTVSLGKGYLVPNFSEFTPESAVTSVEGLQVQVKTVYSLDVPYGQLIAQSVAAGTKLTSKDNLQVTATYSLGRPYIKDLRGQTLEGDLPKLFYDEYQSKGANVSYTVYYVDSGETKGKVVEMSTFNQYIPLTYNLSIGISRGNLTPTTSDSESSANTSSSDDILQE